MSAHPLCERCLLRTARRLHGGGEAVLVAAQLQGWQYSSARVHRSVKVALRDAGTIPTSADDYVISLETLPGLEPEVIDGI